MGGLNKTGVPSTDNYNLGRGRLYAGVLDTVSERPIYWRDLGNCPEFTIGLETESLEHQSSRQGLRVTDKEVTISQTINLNITLDNLEFDNLAIFFSATTAEYNSTSSAQTDEVVLSNVAAETVKGKWIDLVDSNGLRVYNLASSFTTSTDFVVQVSNNATFGGSPTTLILDDDYLVDRPQGRIFITSNGTNTSSTSGNFSANVWIRYSAVASAVVGAAIDELRLFQQTSQSAALKFIAENPANADEQTEWTFHKVSLTAEGDISMIGDDWSQIPLSGVAEESTLADSDAPVGRARTYPNAGVAA